MKTLEKSIPIFPLAGALLLPSGNLPLNIFEPRYISMMRYALNHNKFIGMIQPKTEGSDELFKIGCLGKITNCSEISNKLYLINLKGIVKFEIQKEINHSKKFKIFNVKCSDPSSDFNKFDKKLFNKKLFINKLKSYFKKRGLGVNWPSLEDIENKILIINSAMICPFQPNEKQALLECENINKLASTIISLLDFSINQQSSHESIN